MDLPWIHHGQPLPAWANLHETRLAATTAGKKALQPATKKPAQIVSQPKALITLDQQTQRDR